ncbi:MAG: hypothetical protein QXT53_00725 [Ignisphaera sp.]
MSELPISLSLHGRWFEKINVSALGNDVRRTILERVKNRFGHNKTVEVLGISKGSLHN